MPVSVQLNTPLADALNSAIQPKLEQYGWATGGADDAALTEYIILMLVNGKTQEEVTRELSTDLLGLDPNDPGLLEFSNWLFSTIDALSAQFGSGDAQAEAATGAALAASGAPDEDQDMDLSTNDGGAEFNAYVDAEHLGNGWHHTNFYQTYRPKGHAKRRRQRARKAACRTTEPCDGQDARERPPPRAWRHREREDQLTSPHTSDRAPHGYWKTASRAESTCSQHCSRPCKHEPHV
jgi:hypothetical protein